MLESNVQFFRCDTDNFSAAVTAARKRQRAWRQPDGSVEQRASRRLIQPRIEPCLT